MADSKPNENLMQQDRKSGKPMKISITLPTNAYFISGIRDFTLGLIKNTTSFSEQWAFRFQSVVDELCNNAIEYGSSTESDIRITFYLEPQRYIQIDVEDTGTGSKPTTAEEIKALVDKRSAPDFIVKGIRGRGLSKIVSQWTDELLFADRPEGGLRVTVKKFIDKPEEVKPIMSQPGSITIHTTN